MRGLLSREPVRVYLYGVIVAVVSALGAFGVVSENSIPMILGVGAAVLAVPAVEVARKKTSSNATLDLRDRQPKGNSLADVVAEVEAEAAIEAEDELESFLDAAIAEEDDGNPEPRG